MQAWVRLALGSWLGLCCLGASLIFARGYADPAPRVVFGAPTPQTTADAIAQGGWVELTDAHFDCDAWVIGSGRVPVRHPVTSQELTFTRESVCHGFRADRVEGVLETSASGNLVLRSLAPLDDPLFTHALFSGLVLALGGFPLLWRTARHVAPPRRRPLAELENLGPGARLQGSFWANEAPAVVVLGTMVGLVAYAVWVALGWAWAIAVEEPQIWRDGESRAPVQLDDRDSLWITWMEGDHPAAMNLSLPLTVQLDDAFVGTPAVRVSPDGRTATNVGIHYARSRLLFVGEWLMLCMLGIPVGLDVASALRKVARWVQALHEGSVRLVWWTVVSRHAASHYGIPSHAELTVLDEGGRKRVLRLWAPHEPVFRPFTDGRLEVLVATIEGHALVLAWDGYPFTRRRAARGSS